MNIKDFLDITLNAGCEIGQRTNVITLKKEYTIIYQDKIIAFAHWYELEKKIWVSFNTIYLKWYQNIICNYNELVDSKDYKNKLYKIIKQVKD